MIVLALLCAATTTSTTVEQTPQVRHNWGFGIEGTVLSSPQLNLSSDDVRLPTLALSWSATPRVRIQALASFGWSTVQSDTTIERTDTRISMQAGLRMSYVLLWGGAGYRARLGSASTGPFEETPRSQGVVLEAGFRPELWLHPRLSVHAVVGLGYTFDSQTGGDSNQGLVLDNQPLGALGLTLWWGGH